jgi:hypothetical protein
MTAFFQKIGQHALSKPSSKEEKIMTQGIIEL